MIWNVYNNPFSSRMLAVMTLEALEVIPSQSRALKTPMSGRLAWSSFALGPMQLPLVSWRSHITSFGCQRHPCLCPSWMLRQRQRPVPPRDFFWPLRKLKRWRLERRPGICSSFGWSEINGVSKILFWIGFKQRVPMTAGLTMRQIRLIAFGSNIWQFK